MAGGLYAADGSFNVTVVDGSAGVKAFAADGSINVINNSTGFGWYHTCGALRVTLTASPVNSLYAADGSIYVSVSSYVTGSQRITVVAGSFGGGAAFANPPYGLQGIYFG